MHSLKEVFITSDLYELISIFTYIPWNNMNFFLNLQLYNFDWSVYLYYFLYDITLEKTQLQNDWGTTQQIDRYGIHYIVMLMSSRLPSKRGKGRCYNQSLICREGYLKNIYSGFGCITGFEKTTLSIHSFDMRTICLQIFVVKQWYPFIYWFNT
jgi:hypothetical protein